jgi:hypothetical protein
MKLVKQTLIAAALSTAIFGGVSHSAAIATAYLEITNLVASDANTGNPLVLGVDLLPRDDVTNPILNNGDTRATLDGVTQDETLLAPPVPVNDVGGAGFSCVGACTYVNNAFTYLTKPNDTASSYVVSDIVLTGSIVAGLPGDLGADAQILAESAVLPDRVGSAESNVGTASEFSFVALTNTDITFSGEYLAYLRAALIGGLTGDIARASIDWEVSLIDNTAGREFSFDLQDFAGYERRLVSTQVPGTDDEITFGGAFSGSTTGNFLTAGNQYTLTISHSGIADSKASRVAIPAPLALIGAGLLVLGGIQRRRSRSAAA